MLAHALHNVLVRGGSVVDKEFETFEVDHDAAWKFTCMLAIMRPCGRTSLRIIIGRVALSHAEDPEAKGKVTINDVA